MRIDRAENDSYDWRRDGWLAACSLTAVLLVVSAGIHPGNGFDTFLRMFVFCIALVRGFVGFRRGGAWLPLSAAVIAILFNPARPIGMSAVGWIWCDLIAALWFAIVGAWQLLRRWEPQRGWAAAAVSLGALAVPAVAAMNMPNRDKLGSVNVDENLAVMNAGTNAASADADTNATMTAAMAGAAANVKPAPESDRPIAHAAVNATAADMTNHVRRDEPKVSTETNATREPPLANRETVSPADEPADTEPIDNQSDGNQE